MNIMIIGAGSLGLLFASKIAPFCEQITVVTRTVEQAETLAQQGILLDGVASSTTQTGAPITFNSYQKDEMETGYTAEHPIDYIFLMVKQTAITAELVHYIRTQMTKNTFLVCFQNGVGHELKLGQVIQTDRLLFAVTTEGAKRNGPTSVSHTGHGITYIGGLASTHAIEEDSRHFLLIYRLELAGVHAVLSKNMEVRIWNKLVINSVINPLTAIFRVPNGELLSSEWTRSLMQDLYQEALSLAAAKGIQLPDELWSTILEVCQATSANHSSMLQDIEASRQTEIDYLNGRLVDMGQEIGLELPLHRMMYKMIKAIEN
ncbi:2-dehydropantoate 2-reductase [compost metagenome]